jgi:hypothetical protein
LPPDALLELLEADPPGAPALEAVLLLLLDPHAAMTSAKATHATIPPIAFIRTLFSLVM